MRILQSLAGCKRNAGLEVLPGPESGGCAAPLLPLLPCSILMPDHTVRISYWPNAVGAPNVCAGGDTRMPEKNDGLNRRDFVKTTTGLGAAWSAAPVSNAQTLGKTARDRVPG